jgi:hypothetical protein
VQAHAHGNEDEYVDEYVDEYEDQYDQWGSLER